MATWPILHSTLDAATEMFPTLTAAQISRARPCGTVRQVTRGDILFEAGDTNVSFFILLSGSMEIVQPYCSGERLIVTYAPGQFTGEITMISGQQCLVRGRVTAAGEFLEIKGDGLRALVAKDAELGDIFMRAFILRRLALIREGYGNVVVLGSRHCANTLRLREFLNRNAYPYTFADLDTDKMSQEVLDRFSVKLEEVPVVICDGRKVLRNPSIQQLADCVGLNLSIDVSQVRDVVIVGGGPAGLAAAVYASSEGLDALLIENGAPGGQAGSSSKIENYLGFPTGISGQELTARALAQAQKFGTKIMVGHSVIQLKCDGHRYETVLDNGHAVPARSIIVASGAQYNKPRIANLEQFENRGVYYAATYMESQLCQGEDVIVIGGGNSAGQAAVFLSGTVRKVHMLVRAEELSHTMSRYLIRRITENSAIELHYRTELVELEGDDGLESTTWRDSATSQRSTHPIRHIFIMAGASPRTDWLKGCVAMDDKGFILTGKDLDALLPSEGTAAWPLSRSPLMLETSLPGVFAVGDIRSGSVKRVASAVGEGSMAVQFVHKALAA